MNQYYTPELEEFHVGFEFEYSHNKINYKKQIYDGSQVLKSKSYYDDHGCEYDAVEDDLKHIRVKRLDREDIESLGFRTNEMTTPISFESDFYEKKHKGIFRVCLVENEHFVYVKKMYEKDVKTIFSGIIKNKSELNRLLKQLGI